MQYDKVRAISWQGDHLKLLDQRRLPKEQAFIECHNIDAVAAAIRDMVVRGAPAIGISAAYAVVMAAQHYLQADVPDWQQCLKADMDRLAQARPTAVNLAWAITQMQAVIEQGSSEPLAALLQCAHQIHDDDIAANRKMGELGADVIAAQTRLLTHCNTGSLATGGYGTALGVIRSCYQRDPASKIYADETRPWLQGARLTAWELLQDNIPVQLIVEGAAAYLMQLGMIDWVVVGADRITANGDVANKIGTYSLAVLAKQHNVKFMVVAPVSTIDMSLASGADIPIEERGIDELLSLHGQYHAPATTGAWNPVFDITPAGLIDVLVTQARIVQNPNTEKMLALMQNT